MSNVGNIVEFRSRKVNARVAHTARCFECGHKLSDKGTLSILENQCESRREELQQLNNEIAQAEMRLETLRRLERSMRYTEESGEL